MKRAVTSLLSFLGLAIQGDLDGITCYRSKRGTVIWYPQAPPTTPPSDLQQWNRDRWAEWIDDWMGLGSPTRQKWIELTSKAHLRITALNLYIAWRASQDNAFIHTLERQTGITVL